MTELKNTGYYEGTDSQGTFWKIPRFIDPEIDGTRLAARHPVRFNVSVDPDSIPIEEFDRLLESELSDDVIGRIEAVIEAGKFLADKGLADIPPLDLRAWRRGMIVSWLHARDLVVVHDALGHPRKNVAGHDMDEVVFARHLQKKLSDLIASGRQADQWYKDYVTSLDQGALVNVGFFNPHISASLYKWGDAKAGVQNAMDAHRLAAHHQGVDENPLDWVERAVNFVVHHIPREHMGIRHEPRGEWSELESRMAEDPAIKDAEIGKVIARDAAKLFEMLEKEGKVVPWQLLAVPDTIPPSAFEHARLVMIAAKSKNSHGFATGNMLNDDEDESLNPARVLRAQALMDKLPRAVETALSKGDNELARTYNEWIEEMNDLESQKAAAAHAAVSEVLDGMLVGLGTGSTAAYAVKEIGRRVSESSLKIKAVATSVATDALARSVGIDVIGFEDVSLVDLTIDGADEIDPLFNAIKGGGGALLREKVVASASKRTIIIVDSSKPVEYLGRFNLPIEILPFAVSWVEYSLRRLNGDPKRRMRNDGTPFLTDQGNMILDTNFGLIENPLQLATELDNIPGIVEHGLFLTEIDSVYIGRPEGVEIRHKK